MARSNGIDDRGYTDTFEREREKLKKKRQAERDSLRHSWEKQLDDCDKQEQGLYIALQEGEITEDRFWSYMSRIDDKRVKADKARRKALGLPEVDEVPEPTSEELTAALRRDWVTVNWKALCMLWSWLVAVVKKDLKK